MAKKQLESGKTTAFLLLHPEEIREEQYALLENAVPVGRRRKAEQYRRTIDRKNCILAYCLLRYALKICYEIEAMPQLLSSKWGKPRLFAAGFPEFSWAHCDKGLLCAVSDRCVGCDIQNTLAHSCCPCQWWLHQQELDTMPECNTDGYFAKLWTLKESYMKCFGCRLTSNMNMLNFSDCEGLDGILPAHCKVMTWGQKDDVHFSICSNQRAEIHEITTDMIYEELCG